MDSENHQQYMLRALELAEDASKQEEVPVGAVIVLDGQIIGEGYNRPISTCDPSAHAEIVALRHASLTSQNYRLPGSVLYVTIEPCLMCYGAMVHARVDCVVYGASEPKAGVFSNGLVPAVGVGPFNHVVDHRGGICEEEARRTMQLFFKRRRENKKALKGIG